MEPNKKSASGHVKEHGGSYLKLAAAIGALVTVLNGYMDLQKNQEALLQAMSVKLNALSAKVSYIEGRLDLRKRVGTPREEARAAPKRRMVDDAYTKVPKSFKELRRAVKAREEGE